MRLCMFHPVEHPMERGWVGRIEGEHVIHLAAQSLQAFFTGGGKAREHAVYPLEGARLLAPVLHPPSVRIFDHETSFAFANPAAIVAPGSVIGDIPSEDGSDAPSAGPPLGVLAVLPRVAAVIGADREIGGFTVFAEWRRTDLAPPKDRDFALGLGPVVVTPDELEGVAVDAIVRLDGNERLRRTFDPFDWEAARASAVEGTTLYPGDLLVGPTLGEAPVGDAEAVDLEVLPIGVLSATVRPGETG
jgi:hypothetical protein